jgi:hypothetical protein
MSAVITGAIWGDAIFCSYSSGAWEITLFGRPVISTAFTSDGGMPRADDPWPPSGGPLLPCRGGLPAPADPTIAGDIKDQIQHGRDGQADRGPTDHIQRVVRPQIHPGDALQVASTNATTAQRRDSTSPSSPAMAKVVMMACPETKLSPAECTPRRTASGTVVPGRSRCTSSLTARSRASFNSTTSTSAAASRQRRTTSAPAATSSGMASTPRY